MIDLKEITIADAAKAVGGHFTENGTFCGVCTDSRKICKGCLFVALEGEKFDGHDFIKNAEKEGAAAVLCRKRADCSVPVIYVDDTREALLQLASYYRSLFDVRVVGLTGSVGKTTTKEMTALVMSSEYETIKTKGNLNNDIGMPMTLFDIEPSTQTAVIEMGMNHKGEIARLTAVSRPDCAIITNIGVSHIENLGSRENILHAKLEILEGMKKGSYLFLNGDNDLLSTVENDDYKIIFFGINNDKCSIRATDIEESSDCTMCNVLFQGKKYAMKVPVAGIHNVYDALAAFAAGVYAGIPPERAASAIADYVPAGMRQKLTRKNGIMFIEDCYNASPDSVKAALNTLSAMDASRRIAVLGDMLELGNYSVTAHSECGKYAAEKGIDILFAYGEASKNTAKAAAENGVKEIYEFCDENALADELLRVIRNGDAVLFKASRGMKLENIINILYKKTDD